MKCELEKQINHREVREQFRQTLIHCLLLERHDVGMSSLGVICGGCCIRIQQLLEAKADLLLRSIISLEDYKRNPDMIMEYLPEHLKEYYVGLRRLGKTMNDVSSACSHCRAEHIGKKPVHASEAQEMTECGRNDLR